MKGRISVGEYQEIWLLVFKHAQRLKVEVSRAVGYALEFAELVGIIESDGYLKAKNSRTSARGMYQFVRGSVEPAVNRLKKYIGHRPWMDQALVHKDASRLSWIEQTLLFLGNMLEKKGSDRYMSLVLESGDKDAMLEAYLKLHHTNPDEATLERARRVFYGEQVGRLEEIRGFGMHKVSRG
jgi:hypothetical protein